MFSLLLDFFRLGVLLGVDAVRHVASLVLLRRLALSSSSTEDMANYFEESGFSSARTSLCDVLRSLIINNIEHFQDDRSLLGISFSRAFCRFLRNLNSVECQANEVASFAHLYDLEPRMPGNGYRSQVAVVDSCVVQCIRVCRTVCVQRNAFLFRREHYLKEVEAYSDMMGCLDILLHHLKTLRARSATGALFPEPGLSSTELLLEAENIDTVCFYGRCLGFQFCESMKKPLKFLSIMMASFSDAYYNTGGVVLRTASSLISCGKYTYSPEDRARRIVEVSQKASVDFCKAFWLLQETELLKQVPEIVCPSVPVNKVIQIASEPLRLPRIDGSMVNIPIPSSHLRPAPVICRLLSASVREGQLSETEVTKAHAKVMPPSPYLIIQCHGGGFVAQSSKSHEVYLRDWASQLDVPFLCLDYSLAPDAPYPRALEECLYAYAWAVQNANRLGSTGERICLVGDSAGGNLMMGVTLKTIELGIRKPDGIYALYTPLLIDFVPSPSRLLCIMDPMLPFGFMMRCLKAYAGQPTSDDGEKSFDCGQDGSPSESIGPASATCSSNVSHASTPSHEPPPLSPSLKEDQVAIGELVSLDNPKTMITSNHVDAVSNVSSQQVKENDINTVSGTDTDAMVSSSVSFVEVTADDLMELQKSTTDGPSATGVSGSATMSSISLQSNGSVCSSPTHVDKRSEKDYVRDFMDWYVVPDKPEETSDDATTTDSPATVAPLRSESSEQEENVLFELPVEFPRSMGRRVTSVTGSLFAGLSDLGSRRKGQPSRTTATAADSRSASGQRLLPPPQPVAQSASTVKKTNKKSEGIFANRKLADGGTVSSVILEFEKFKVEPDRYLSPYLASDEVLRQLPKVGFLSLTLDPCLDDSIMFCKRLRKLGKEIQIDILDSLPHGFLNFAMISKDAHDASRLCVQRLRELLNMTASPH